jgi:hypothetical protein
MKDKKDAGDVGVPWDQRTMFWEDGLKTNDTIDQQHIRNWRCAKDFLKLQ